MRVIAKPVLIAFWIKHSQAEQPLRSWYQEAMRAKWKRPQDIKNQYSSVSFVGNNHVVFNVGGNNYRLVVGVDYVRQALFIKFVGTHAEYDKIDVEAL